MTKPMIAHTNISNGIRPRILQFLNVLLLLLYAVAAKAAPLPSYNVDISETSVSGISSGGYMALQLSTAHSDIVTGVGVFAGGPYRCAADGVNAALGPCLQGQPDPLEAIAKTETAADNGSIAPPNNMARQRVWLFSGYNDGVVKQSVMNSLYDYVTHYVPASQVYYQDTLGTGHAMITQQYGAECQLTSAPFVNDCDYDGAGLLLQHIYGKLTEPLQDLSTGKVLSFDQTAFTHQESHRIGLAKLGYLYAPEACTQQLHCRVHVVFHGCRQFAGEVNDVFYRNAGYNQWADNNRIIILYPQTQASSLGPFNPRGCWDWWGYTGADFAYRNGAQIEAVRSMLEQLSQGYRPAGPVSPDMPPELLAIDATDRSVSLVWSSSQHTSGYHLYRALDNSGQFERVNDNPVKGNSYVDWRLSPATTYSYRLEFITHTGEILVSNTTTITTRSPSVDCDPYYNDNVTHVSNDRAYVWFGLTFARGSWDYMGLWSLFAETALFRDGDGFQVGVCTEGKG